MCALVILIACAWWHAGAADGYSPAELRVYTNRDDLDFAAVEDLPPVQQWDLAENLQGLIELPTQVRCTGPGLRFP